MPAETPFLYNVVPLLPPAQLRNRRVQDLERSTKEFHPGAIYVAFFDRWEGLLFHTPELALTSSFGHPIDYGDGAFEGSSAMMNETTGVPHVILSGPRDDRLYNKTLKALGYSAPISQHEFEQRVLDLVAVHGTDLFRNPDPEAASKNPFVRAYIRPTVHPRGASGLGVQLRKDYPIDMGVMTWTWPDYRGGENYKKGAKLIVNGSARTSTNVGKVGWNYGAAVVESTAAALAGGTEHAFLAPYLVDGNGQIYWADPNDFDQKIKYGALSDTPGSEIIGLLKDGKTFVYIPMRANILGGTVSRYIIDHMHHAKDVNVQMREGDITLEDLRKGKYIALAAVGNAYKIAPVGEVGIVRNGQQVDSIELFPPYTIPDPLVRLMDRWDGETRGLVPPSHESLVTPVDPERGQLLREALDEWAAQK